MWFYERMTLGGWWPVTAADRPETKMVGGRELMRTATGLGPQIRNLTEVPDCLTHLTLDRLAELRGGDRWLAAAAGGPGA